MTIVGRGPGRIGGEDADVLAGSASSAVGDPPLLAPPGCLALLFGLRLGVAASRLAARLPPCASPGRDRPRRALRGLGRQRDRVGGGSIGSPAGRPVRTAGRRRRARRPHRPGSTSRGRRPPSLDARACGSLAASATRAGVGRRGGGGRRPRAGCRRPDRCGRVVGSSAREDAEQLVEHLRRRRSSASPGGRRVASPGRSPLTPAGDVGARRGCRVVALRRRHRSSRREPDQADLAAQDGSRWRRRPPGAHRLDHGPDVVGRPPSSAWMKLACFSETQADADAQAAQAEAVDQAAGADLAGHRVDEHRAGVLPARLVLAPPPHDLGELGLGLGPVAGAARAIAAATTTSSSARAEPRKRSPSDAASRSRRRAGCARSTRVDRRAGRRPCRSRGRRRSSARRRRPSRARRPPTRTPSAPRPPSGGPARGATAPPPARRPCCRIPASTTARSPAGEVGDRHGHAGEAGVGDEQVGAPPDDEHGHAGCRPRARRDRGAGRRASAPGRTAPPARPPGTS